MSTLLVNTRGGSYFRDSVDLLSEAATEKGASSIRLNNTDGQAVLVPNGIIDVVRDFGWYAGPKATDRALDRVPCAFLIEREQLLSSLISGAMYYLNAAADSLQEVFQSNYLRSLLATINVSDKLYEALDTAGNFLGDFKNAMSNGDDKKLLETHNLKSLTGIYFTRETGFNYRLPIYGSPSEVSTSWGDAAGESVIKGVIDDAQGVVQNIAEFVNIAQPGVYIEKPKYFTGYDSGPTRSITFPLVNTVSRTAANPIQQNYELLWLLAFQNKAYKTSFARTPPPKLYTISVPGQFSMPYAFISSMKVEFLGTTRRSKVFVPSGNGEGKLTFQEMTVPVPDAYQVTLEFTSLIGDYGNIMLSDAFNSVIQDNAVVVGNKS